MPASAVIPLRPRERSRLKASLFSPRPPMQILLANPRGFCAGVNMAIDCLDEAIRMFGPNIYVYHEIVHNKYVVDRFTRQGVTFVNDVDEVPHGSILLFSAHGVSPEIRQKSRARRLQTIDATCPLVTKVHMEAIRYARDGYHIILIGHEGHDEVIGTMGEAPESITLVDSPEEVAALAFPAGAKLAYLTQTTLSVDEAGRVIRHLKERFPHIESPPKEDICYATTNRQEAVARLAARVDVVVVLGSQTSSNSQRLKEIGQTTGKPAHLIDGPHELRAEWFEGCGSVLITAGASAPEVVVQECVDYLVSRFGATVEEVMIREEHVSFPLPRELRLLQAKA
jgi:4-hydroxy-3-methylbut-2-en-1-yl diphosphate reductase